MKANHKLTLVALCLGLTATAVPADASTHCYPQQIAFAAGVDGHDQIFTIRPNGTGLRQITSGNNNYRNPDWSPDGRLLAYEADDGVSTSWLVVAHADGSKPRALPVLGAQVGQPSFSSDGRRLFFERYDGAQEDAVYSVDLAGRHLQRITTTPAGHGDTDPNVSPDGKALSFVRLSDGSEDGPAALFVQDLVTGHARQLTSYATNVAIKQDWSPDNRHIGFTRDGYDRPPGANSNVVVINRSGKRRHDVTQFVDGTTQAFFGSYSPDGRWIVIRREDGDLHSLVKVHPDGSHPVTIMSIPGFSPHFIAWGPSSR